MDFVQDFWLALSEKCMRKSNGLCVRLKIGIRPQFLKAIKVQLPNETGKLGMIEVFRKNLLFEGLHIPNGETVTSVGPGDDGGISTLINHVVCLGKKLVEEGSLVLGRF
jgi:hypothetical protein